ncbi:unnamed protein product [Prunus armeniaca]
MHRFPSAPLESDLPPQETHLLPLDNALMASSRPHRDHHPPAKYSYYLFYLTNMLSLHEPSSYIEASANPLWQQAMSEELDALAKTNTWELVQLPRGKIAIGCKWVYKIKTKFDGCIDLYKAHLVAKGFNTEYGVDYAETFAYVARMPSVRTLIAVASVRQWTLHQMDVKNAFIHVDLHEEVYMKPPPGFPHSPNQVCKLQRALYGLKQAPQAWFEKFRTFILTYGFSQSPHDSAMFTCTSDHGIVILLLYVDDMVITGSDLDGIQCLKSHLQACFEMKDLGQLRYFLGLTDSKVVNTPLEQNVKLHASDDISHAVHIVSQFMAAPQSVHFVVVLHILRLGWRYHLSSFNYWILYLGDSLISWKSKKQTVVARSSAKAEYRALAHTTSEVLWLPWLLHDMGVILPSCTSLFCDNKSAIQIARNDVFHERTKHIEVDCHFIRHHVSQGTISLFYLASEHQSAYLFTKSHSEVRFWFLLSKLHMLSRASSV